MINFCTFPNLYDVTSKFDITRQKTAFMSFFSKATCKVWCKTYQKIQKQSKCNIYGPTVLGCVCRGRGVVPHISDIVMQPHSGRVFAPFRSENGYTLCPLAKSGIVFEITTRVYERIHRFNLQMSKKEREIWINNMDKRKLCCRPFPHTSLRIHSHCAKESWRAYL